MAELRELSLRFDRKQIDRFLQEAGLRTEPDLTHCAGVYEGDALLAFGGLAGRTIKCVAVQEDRRSEALLNSIVSHLYTTARRAGAQSVFVFTKPEYGKLFAQLGFTALAQAEQAALLESDAQALPRYLDALLAQAPAATDGSIGAVVLNANPFTLGHQYLLEQAAARCALLHVFVVEEERSAFPFDARLALVRAGCAHIPHAVVHAGGPYIISAATFPSYFIKDPAGAAPAHAALDAALFATRIAPALHISERFCGEEPLDPLTRLYNDTLCNVLPRHQIGFTTIPRHSAQGEVISASRVRALLARGKIAAAYALLPPCTQAYLQTPAGLAVQTKLAEQAELAGQTKLAETGGA